MKKSTKKKGKKKSRTVILLGKKLEFAQRVLQNASKDIGIFVKGAYPLEQIQKHFKLKEEILFLDDDEIKKLDKKPDAPDRDVEIIAKVQNAGSISSGPFKVELLIDGAHHDEATVSNLPANSSTFIHFTYSWTTTPGQHDIKVIVDPKNQVSEIIENNNVASRRVYVFDCLIANSNSISMEVHLPTCPWVSLILPQHRVVYTSLKEAHEDGYDNCYWCIGDSLR